jgi:hypothetical protein
VSQADYNCDCVDANGNETLAQLRRRLMIRGGYAAMADNPPPGFAIYLDDLLRSAQKQLYEKNSAFRTERLYRWTMTPGVSYYGIRDNDSETDFTDITCGKHLDEYGVHWVGLQDLNNMWMPMACGINPTLYTTAQQQGLPQLYEVRSCIEVFPVPNAAYHLWIKGRFGVEPFTGDNDQTTINSELVFLQALADLKADKGRKDAQKAQDQASAYLRDLIAGKHLTRRYVPGKIVPPPAVQPVMTDFNPPV